ncbi:MAG: hypothetical protein IJT25_00520 [Clostridia bacterium]|nr:hypothetical protein [Clostridia bacterium]
MNIKDKMKTYNFWISLVSALLLVARILGTKYGFTIDSGLVMDVTTAMCSVFVILGIISAPQKVVTKYQTLEDENKVEKQDSSSLNISETDENDIKTIFPIIENENADSEILNENFNASNKAENKEEFYSINTAQEENKEDNNYDEQIEQNRVITNEAILNEAHANSEETNDASETENNNENKNSLHASITLGNLEELSKEELIKIICSKQ